MTLAHYFSEFHYGDHLSPIIEELRKHVEVKGGTGHQGFTEAQEADYVLTASRKDSKRFSKVILVEHGSGQRYGKNAGGPDTPEPQVVLFLAGSQWVCDQDAHIYPNALRVPVGSPRVEHLSKLERNPEKVVIAFHWQAGTAQESRSAWTHHQRALPSLKEFPMLGHGHPRMIRRLVTGYQRQGIPVEWDWTKCVSQAKALICDNSSIIYEACALDIPVVLLDAPWYKQDWGLRFWEFADVGPRTQDHSEVASLVSEVLERDVWGERRREAAEYVYGELRGSAERAVRETLSL